MQVNKATVGPIKLLLHAYLPTVNEQIWLPMRSPTPEELSIVAMHGGSSFILADHAHTGQRSTERSAPHSPSRLAPRSAPPTLIRASGWPGKECLDCHNYIITKVLRCNV